MNTEKEIEMMKLKSLEIMESVNSLDSSFNESNEKNAADLIAKIKIDLTNIAIEFDGVVTGPKFTAITDPIMEIFKIKVDAFNKYMGEK